MSVRRANAFSLLELIVVMVLLTVAAALVAPRLSGFFRGRRLDDEARRLWALTRYAQEQAVVHAVPVELWVDTETGEYGLAAAPGYGYTLPALSYDLAPDLEVVAEPAPAKAERRLALTWWPDGSLGDDTQGAWVLRCRQQTADAWRLTRQSPLSTFSLAREVDG